ncbi:hypothetical protein PsorP6_002146 [Peronosclerospora sorghi]|uniref:Uncharacterized protein n=1 Tax=Peronosclerospora sorghi TaxID=230839 RepID=A0ACC0WTL6_9STRA|nr:hypothetical protein PsorP6_002146 [Peronosclerospora sorghi]
MSKQRRSAYLMRVCDSHDAVERKTFEGRSLHYIDPTGRVVNPYQRHPPNPIFFSMFRESSRPSRACLNYLTTITRFQRLATVASRSTCRRLLLFFVPGGRECDLDEILQQYFALASSRSLTAPASFVPVIYEAIQRVQVQSRYHILILVTNGHVEEPAVARQAIVEASAYPLCTYVQRINPMRGSVDGKKWTTDTAFAIIMIGVGDGPWTLMQEFDNKVPERLFDNFQFVNNKKTFFITGELQETVFLHERTNGVVVIWNSLKRSCFAKSAAHY